MRTATLLLISTLAYADGPGRIESVHASKDFALTADPQSTAWKGVPGVIAENGAMGKPTPGHRTEIRSRWTKDNLYFLFICPYEKLFSKENPATTTETNKLWEWDVAEVFVGADFKTITRYREYQVSPHGEWVDLDIDRVNALPEGGWKWDSGFKVKARLDEANKVWYGEMQIPVASINGEGGAPAKATPGAEMRVNFYRLQGPKPNRAGIAWQPTNTPTYHTPEAFGRLILKK